MDDPDNFHLIQDSEYRDYDFVCKSDISEDDDMGSHSDDDNPSDLDGVAIYPDALITSGKSILSIMKYAIRHKTTYSALNDLLGLIALHLPKESNKEHLKSVSGRKCSWQEVKKKAFLAGSEKDDVVTIDEYCLAPFGNSVHAVCRFCGAKRIAKGGKSSFIIRHWEANQQYVSRSVSHLFVTSGRAPLS